MIPASTVTVAGDVVDEFKLLALLVSQDGLEGISDIEHSNRLTLDVDEGHVLQTPLYHELPYPPQVGSGRGGDDGLRHYLDQRRVDAPRSRQMTDEVRLADHAYRFALAAAYDQQADLRIGEGICRFPDRTIFIEGPEMGSGCDHDVGDEHGHLLRRLAADCGPANRRGR